ncbi:hypothetical protein ACKZDW_16275 [Ralstonia syzygii subsp. celebesensis]|uniref:Uncharacterized protein n=1 Tax=blood disease bacterium R229 TaxID=741978 RepID=G2ZNS7_9RALS|nr:MULTISPECIES: hypothetical protein [Ralstonia solanacearum species complex]QQV57123.1 hypothetical protein JK151_02715 [Ralstonia syzygii subsp. celebesensis]CCA80696.1 hypothetical protein BDB_110127 [blood disease bacterium R229]
MPALEISESIVRRCTRDLLPFNPDHSAGKDVFAALTRTTASIRPTVRDVSFLID